MCVCFRQRSVRKAKMKTLRAIGSDCSSDSDAPSPKRLARCAQDDEFIDDEDTNSPRTTAKDALSFDDNSSSSFEYSQESVDDNFLLPEYASARAWADARNKSGLSRFTFFGMAFVFTIELYRRSYRIS